mmetsp:Transcript_24672/g.37260  ORF Transcript_24672/g.37260 Transcript_24672/m.37260 type:complete len:135 (+) Transcript_24672:72-476(+)|eukprot:CAMPEP_0194199516 /NCGR_PEP_ID=MMETSP0156-20130528/509_1 /TAXON_ID=33649 /ORGANISM="Thalassionema nitzschioides, Strain L26-B" /LENGTH=134 /DNA_ID=CAMNT_0038924423 /DNA_START=66 /DNA_END=470 /DNA_ORIENTATION=+
MMFLKNIALLSLLLGSSYAVQIKEQQQQDTGSGRQLKQGGADELLAKYSAEATANLRATAYGRRLKRNIYGQQYQSLFDEEQARTPPDSELYDTEGQKDESRLPENNEDRRRLNRNNELPNNAQSMLIHNQEAF